MPIHLSCIICAETYKATDIVHCTTCGHIFHERCLTKWQIQNLNCPQCREENPGSHKIYLTFDDVVENNNELDELKTSLEQTQKNANRLSQLKTALNSQLRQSKKALSDAKLQIRQLNKRNAEYEKKSISLNDKLKKSETNIKWLTQNLEKVHLELEELKEANESCSHFNGHCDCNNDQPSTNETDDENRCVVVRGNPRFEYENSAEQIVRKLYKCMNLRFRISDIEKNYFLEENSNVPEHISMVVQFKNLELKALFMKNKFKLKTSQETSKLNIFEYGGDKLNALFRYALNLKSVGYKSVCRRNNKIFATLSNNQTIRINTYSQVMDLMEF